MTPAVPLVNTTSTRPPLAVMPALVRGWTQNLLRTNALAAASELGTDRSRGSTERIMMLALVPWNAKALTPMAVVASFEDVAVAAQPLATSTRALTSLIALHRTLYPSPSPR